MTIKEATQRWIMEMNAIPQSVVEKLMRFDCDSIVEVTVSDEYFYDVLPMWGTMWTFGDQLDNWWLEEGDGFKLMSECGFRIYESDDFGYIFGIDGAGYDFYEAHWIPLYKARELKWHDQNEEE